MSAWRSTLMEAKGKGVREMGCEAGGGVTGKGNII